MIEVNNRTLIAKSSDHKRLAMGRPIDVSNLRFLRYLISCDGHLFLGIIRSEGLFGVEFDVFAVTRFHAHQFPLESRQELMFSRNVLTDVILNGETRLRHGEIEFNRNLIPRTNR